MKTLDKLFELLIRIVECYLFFLGMSALMDGCYDEASAYLLAVICLFNLQSRAWRGTKI